MNPDVDINPVSGVLTQSAYYPDSPALVYADRDWTYRQLADEVAGLVRAVAARGVTAGDRVAYLGLNSVTFLETMLAAWWLRAVFEPLNFRLAPAEVSGAYLHLAVAPLFHIGGLNAMAIRLLVRGGRNVIRRTFDPRQTIRDIEEYGVQQAFLVPAMLTAMHAMDEFAEHDISSLRSLICAGAPVPPVLLRQYEAKGVPVQQAWGLTETAPFATYFAAELTHVKPGSCGLPMPYTRVRICDPATGEDITAPGQTGELLVKGPNVTPGYWRNEEATRNAFTDGWFRSGDLGYRDEDGFIFIVDRLKDMIITGGENVYLAEVERALMEFPGALDVAVVGIPDERWGESVVAVMTLREGVTPTIEEVREFAATLLARYKLPRELVLTAQMPRNGSGKLDKPAIRSLVRAETSGA